MWCGAGVGQCCGEVRCCGVERCCNVVRCWCGAVRRENVVRRACRKPIPWRSFERTHERMMKSFSRPWKASTEATSTSAYMAWVNTDANSGEDTAANRAEIAGVWTLICEGRCEHRCASAGARAERAGTARACERARGPCPHLSVRSVALHARDDVYIGVHEGVSSVNLSVRGRVRGERGMRRCAHQV